MSPPVARGVEGRISIVVPSFNQASYLDEALDSIVSQDYPDVELIVMDGGSTDGSVDVIRRYQDRVAHWQSQPDGGQSNAIHAGFVRSTGAVLGWLNSDDRLVPGALATVGRSFAALDAEWIYGDTEVIDVGSNLIEVRRTVAADIVDLVNLSYYLPQESTFFRRSLYFRAGGIESSLDYAMDYDLWLKFAHLTAPHHVDARLGCFRYRPGQKSDDPTRYRAEERRVKEGYGSYVLPRRARAGRLVRLKASTLRRRVRADGVTPILRKQVRTLRGDGPKLGSSRLLAGALVVGIPASVVAGVVGAALAGVLTARHRSPRGIGAAKRGRE